MSELESGIIGIPTRDKNNKYGDLKNTSAHGLYKKYKAWVAINSPTKKALPFKDWIKWAKEKGIIKNYNADADIKNALANETGGITYHPSLTKNKTNELEAVKDTGKTIAKIVIGVSALIIILSFVKFGKSGGDANTSDDVASVPE